MKNLLIFLGFFAFHANGQNLAGAWKNVDGQKNNLIIATENYISFTEFTNKEFVKTWGGKYSMEKGVQVYITVEFNSSSPEMVGTIQTFNAKLKKENLKLNKQDFKRVNPDGQNALTGLWYITGRANPEGEISAITPGARKTLKIMADGYFQWVALNSKTAEFFGTGGGNYSLENGTYTENIQFFSRDNSRVGASLSFSADVDDGQWTHAGKSSKGDPIKEIWTKQ